MCGYVYDSEFHMKERQQRRQRYDGPMHRETVSWSSVNLRIYSVIGWTLMCQRQKTYRVYLSARIYHCACVSCVKLLTCVRLNVHRRWRRLLVSGFRDMTYTATSHRSHRYDMFSLECGRRLFLAAATSFYFRPHLPQFCCAFVLTVLPIRIRRKEKEKQRRGRRRKRRGREGDGEEKGEGFQLLWAGDGLNSIKLAYKLNPLIASAFNPLGEWAVSQQSW